MCFSGKCKYEQYSGDCKISLELELGHKIPKDAACYEKEEDIIVQELIIKEKIYEKKN
jgi:hypothetical protein